jgi:hypothetical protein
MIRHNRGARAGRWALALAAALLAATTCATAQAQDPQGHLVYLMEHEDPPQCYSPPCRSDDLEPGPQYDWIETARADGSERRALTPSGPAGQHHRSCRDGQPRFLGTPRVSPNGRLIARPYCHKILLTDLSGGLVQTLSIPGDVFALDWSPSGRRIAAQTYNGPGDKPRLYVVDRNDNAHRAIATEAGSDVRWWAHRDLIAYKDISRDGGVTLVTPGGRIVHRVKGDVDGFDLSPTDRRIAYPCKSGACVMRFDGSHRHVLTGRCVHDMLLASVAWSPDGHWIACLSPRAVVVVDLSSDRYRVIRQLRDGDAFEAAYDLDWGPAPASPR